VPQQESMPDLEDPDLLAEAEKRRQAEKNEDDRKQRVKLVRPVWEARGRLDAARADYRRFRRKENASEADPARVRGGVADALIGVTTVCVDELAGRLDWVCQQAQATDKEVRWAARCWSIARAKNREKLLTWIEKMESVLTGETLDQVWKLVGELGEGLISPGERGALSNENAVNHKSTAQSGTPDGLHIAREDSQRLLTAQQRSFMHKAVSAANHSEALQSAWRNNGRLLAIPPALADALIAISPVDFKDLPHSFSRLADAVRVIARIAQRATTENAAGGSLSDLSSAGQTIREEAKRIEEAERQRHLDSIARTHPEPTPNEGATVGNVGAESTEKENGHQVESELNSTNAAAVKPQWHRVAIGLEAGNKWHLFRQFKGEWRQHKLVTGISKGRQASFLKALADHGGFLTKVEFLKSQRETFSGADVGKLMNTIKPEISKLRKAIRTAASVTDTRADPLPFETQQNGWRAAIKIGYAVQDDGDHLGGERRLRFKTREELSGDERMDR
jgi:hypothetical protein